MSGQLAALAAYGLPETRLRLPDRPLDATAWGAFVGAATSSKLIGLLARATAEGAMAVTPAQAEEVTELHLLAMTRVLRIERRVVELTRRLGDEGLAVRVLKGPAHAHLLAVDPSDRAFADLDLLVRDDHLPRAIELIEAAGFHRDAPERRPGYDRRFSKGATFVDADGEAVDLHRTLVAGPLGLRIRPRDMFEVSDSFVVGGHRVNGLDPLHRLLHCGYLGSVADWPVRPLACRELVLSLGAAGDDPDAVVGLAAHWGAGAALADAVRRAVAVLDLAGTVPLLEWARRYEPSARERFELRIYQGSYRSPGLLLLSGATAVPGVRDKAAYVRGLVLPDRDEGRDGPLTRWPRAVRGLLGRWEPRRRRRAGS